MALRAPGFSSEASFSARCWVSPPSSSPSEERTFGARGGCNGLGGRVWALVVKTAAAVKESLQAENTTLEDTKKVLLEGYQATKREVDDALTAFNQERDFYAAAVGIPGLRTAQYVIDHMMPGLIAQKLENSMADSSAHSASTRTSRSRY